MPEETTLITIDDVRQRLPERPSDAHKGTFGHLFVLAGSRGFTGAAWMTSRAASRAGVGLVTAGVPETLADLVGGMLHEAMSLPLPGTPNHTLGFQAITPALRFAETTTAIALGPGLSQDSKTQQFVWGFVQRCPKPMVIDADGLNALAQRPAELHGRQGETVITPHPGEMSRLSNRSVKEIQARREDTARDFANRFRCTVVLKGQDTVIADPDGMCVRNPTGNSGMATGGTGDVLTGIIGALLAQGLTGPDAAVAGVYLHGLAGDLAAIEKTERGMIAPDVIECMPQAWRRIEEGNAR